MRAQVNLGRIFGFKIGLHFSWLIVAVLIAFSLGGHFGASHPTWGRGVIWAMAIVTSVLFFASHRRARAIPRAGCQAVWTARSFDHAFCARWCGAVGERCHGRHNRVSGQHRRAHCERGHRFRLSVAGVGARLDGDGRAGDAVDRDAGVAGLYQHWPGDFQSAARLSDGRWAHTPRHRLVAYRQRRSGQHASLQ